VLVNAGSSTGEGVTILPVNGLSLISCLSQFMLMRCWHEFSNICRSSCCPYLHTSKSGLCPICRPLQEVDPYTSPEQLHGASSSLDPLKVDVWRAGIIIYSLTIRDCPPVGEPLFHRIPSPARDLVRRMLHPDPCQRIDLEGIKQHPWFLARLPPGALEMNDECLRSTLLGGQACVRSRAEVRAIADEALQQLASARDAQAVDEWSAALCSSGSGFPSVTFSELLND